MSMLSNIWRRYGQSQTLFVLQLGIGFAWMVIRDTWKMIKR